MKKLYDRGIALGTGKSTTSLCTRIKALHKYDCKLVKTKRNYSMEKIFNELYGSIK